jgi:hypothetical protein
VTNGVETLTADHSDDHTRQPTPIGKSTKTKTEPERLPWFDQWRGARGPALRSLVAIVREVLDKHEKARVERKLEGKAKVRDAVETLFNVDGSKKDAA